jgi:hypothetical protein
MAREAAAAMSGCIASLKGYGLIDEGAGRKSRRDHFSGAAIADRRAYVGSV